MDELLQRIEELQQNYDKLKKYVFDFFLEKHILELKNNGYTIIHNVINDEEIETAKKLFYDWKNSIENHDELHSQINPHGIYKFHEIGHQEHAWYLRTRENIINVFKKIWNTDDLVVSFDGTCYIPENYSKKDKNWTHTDQAANTKGITCYQSFISLTNNKERTFVLYDKSHLLHEEYFKEKNISSSNNWCLIDEKYLEKIKESKKILDVKAGDLVIWDSRTFHQNQYGCPNSEERIVQYLCYLPRNNIKNTKTIEEKRKKYFEERRTTSHWPYPIKVNGLQPQVYGDKSKLIDYNKLKKPNLDKYIESIKKLI